MPSKLIPLPHFFAPFATNLSKDILVLSVCKTFSSILSQTQPTRTLKLFLSRSPKMCMLLTSMINFQFSSYWMNQKYLTCFFLNKLISLGFHNPHLLGSFYLPNCSFSVSFAAYSSSSLCFTCSGLSQAQSLVFSFSSTQWFLNFATIGIWGQIILCIVGHTATSLASIHSILCCDHQKCSHTLPTILWGEWGSPMVENLCSGPIGNSFLNILDFSGSDLNVGFKCYVYANNSQIGMSSSDLMNSRLDYSISHSNISLLYLISQTQHVVLHISLMVTPSFQFLKVLRLFIWPSIL